MTSDELQAYGDEVEELHELILKAVNSFDQRQEKIRSNGVKINALALVIRDGIHDLPQAIVGALLKDLITTALTGEIIP